ncbi:hypothetical protein GDO78_013085 [Eleutherodactylus coqui]|uniref:Uncharacterized protein n=1 Tax=Eleutherodactylus coqui TaxID=57060 RepID=A0A8J6K3H4_ELECQ|nr:hypothetical protein GDO78_013085 [Eleutherodactylus coqui]
MAGLGLMQWKAMAGSFEVMLSIKDITQVPRHEWPPMLDLKGLATLYRVSTVQLMYGIWATLLCILLSSFMKPSSFITKVVDL